MRLERSGRDDRATADHRLVRLALPSNGRAALLDGGAAPDLPAAGPETVLEWTFSAFFAASVLPRRSLPPAPGMAAAAWSTNALAAAGPMLIDHDVAGGLVQQGLRFCDRHAGALNRQDTRIAFLHDFGRRIAVFDRAGTKVQQFSVVALKHGSTMAKGINTSLSRLASRCGGG